MEVKEINYPDGIRSIKQINPDYFYMLINADKFSEWLHKNKAIDGYVAIKAM